MPSVALATSGRTPIIRAFPGRAGPRELAMADAPLVGIIMGSQSDWETMRNAAETLDALGVAHEVRIVSAHRTPDRMFDYAKQARGRGLRVIIAGAGGAAHLPGMTASMTSLPVFGVPIGSFAVTCASERSSLV